MFFDAKGVYVGKATPWNGVYDNPSGQPNDPSTSHPDDGSTGNNIEFKGNSVIVLDKLTGKDYPSYIITVLNAPENYKPGNTMEETAKDLASWGTDENFMMTTSSYYDGVTSGTRHDDKYYYATKVTAADFYEKSSDAVAANQAVDIYVERLAAKAQVLATAEKDPTTGMYKVDATVAGNENAGTEVGKTDLYVKFDGWALSNIANNSYFSKNLDGWDFNSDIFTNWNNAGDSRNFWAKSVLYDDFDVEGITRLSWKELNNPIGITGIDYCNEHTAEKFDNVNEQATSVLIAATVCDAKGNGLNMVRYNGLLFNNADFIEYVLNGTNVSGKLNYYYVSKKEQVLDDEGKPAVDGNDKPIYTYEYTQIGKDQMDIDLVAYEADKNRAIVKVSAITLNKAVEGEEANLYAKNSDGSYSEKIEISKAINDINNYIANGDGQDDKGYGDVEAFKEGKMYYNIPIEHLAAVGNPTGTPEGFYGVVRNHWYNISVNKVDKIGHGVFSPGSETVLGEPIVPKEEDKLYYLGATVNILSWKIVNQSVDL